MTPPATSTRAAAPPAVVHEALDGHRMGPRVRAALGVPGRGACHVLDAKYEPGVRCTVLYGVGDRLVRGDLLDDADGLPGGARPVVEPGVRLSVFPDDPDLPGLRRAADPAALRDALRDALPGGGPVLGCRVQLVRYRPAKRATLAVALRARPGRLPAGGQRVVVKSYHDAGKAAAVAAEAVLLDATADPAEPLRFAAVRAHLPELSLVVQEHVDGVPLESALRLPGAAPERALRRAAAALAALHRRPTVSRRKRPVRAEVDRFRVRALRVADVAPATGRVLLELAERLIGTADDVADGAVALVHGDCKPSQFLLRGERDVVLLDLDSCGQADPAGDVATFLATLRQHAVRDALAGRTPPPIARSHTTHAEVFLRAYLEAAGAAPDADLPGRIAWYEAVALERKALRCFARAPRSPLTLALVRSGAAVLDRWGAAR
jgi:aminoglycoside phosphotransferase (APT) family kinase protein